MTTDHDRDAPKPAVPALRSIEALANVGEVLGNVDTSNIARGSGLPMLIYKARENTYSIGANRIIPEPEARWLVDIGTFQRGYIAFVNNKATERMAPSRMPEVDPLTLPDVGVKWDPQWTVHLVCLDGTDAGTEVVFKVSTIGGTQAIAGLYDEVRTRYNAGMTEVIPLVTLGSDHYPHAVYGKTWYPALHIAAWIPVTGPIPSVTPPEPTLQPAAPVNSDQPRRRRVA